MLLILFLIPNTHSFQYSLFKDPLILILDHYRHEFLPLPSLIIAHISWIIELYIPFSYSSICDWLLLIIFDSSISNSYHSWIDCFLLVNTNPDTLLFSCWIQYQSWIYIHFLFPQQFYFMHISLPISNFTTLSWVSKSF